MHPNIVQNQVRMNSPSAFDAMFLDIPLCHPYFYRSHRNTRTGNRQPSARTRIIALIL